jgi:hypothetical protein
MNWFSSFPVWRNRSLLTGFWLAAMPISGWAQSPPTLLSVEDWSFSGEVRAGLRSISLFGNDAAAPLPFDGTHGDVGVTLAADRVRDADRLSIGLDAVMDRSDYLGFGNDPTLYLNTATVTYEAAAEVPYRLTAGNQRALVTRRSLDQSIIGASVELQPRNGPIAGGSVLAFVGDGEVRPDQLGPEDPRFAALSVVAPFGASAVSVNAVLAERRDLGDRQTLLNIAAERDFSLGRQAIGMEAEVGVLSGDVIAANRDTDTATGLFLAADAAIAEGAVSLAGSYERYGEGYAPAGGAAEENSQTLSTTLGLRQSARSLRGTFRVQTSDAFGTGNDPLNSQSVRLDGTPGIALGGFDMSFGVLALTRTAESGATDSATQTISARGTRTVRETATLDLRGSYASNDDRTGGTDTAATTLSAGVSDALAVRGWSGMGRVGAEMRSTDIGGARVIEALPVASVQMNRNAWTARLDVSGFQQLGIQRRPAKP